MVSVVSPSVPASLPANRQLHHPRANMLAYLPVEFRRPAQTSLVLLLRDSRAFAETPCRLLPVALPLLITLSIMTRSPLRPEEVRRTIEGYFAERQAELLPSGEQTKRGKRFSWCGEVLEFFTEGLAARVALQGITFSKSFPGPFHLMDEDRSTNGDHVRRFWTTALEHGCPIARLCTYFFHRHDRVSLPQPPQVMAYPPDYHEPEVLQ